MAQRVAQGGGGCCSSRQCVLWLLAERDVSLPALLRSAVWGLVVWVWGGLVWIALQYGQGREDRREQRGQDAGVVFESHGASRGPIASN
jgi:hypothetical protein